MNQFLNKLDTHSWVGLSGGSDVLHKSFLWRWIIICLPTIIFKLFLIYLTKRYFNIQIVWMNAHLKCFLFIGTHSPSLLWNLWLKTKYCHWCYVTNVLILSGIPHGVYTATNILHYLIAFFQSYSARFLQAQMLSFSSIHFRLNLPLGPNQPKGYYTVWKETFPRL